MHLEVGIAKSFLCTWPLLWVPPQHILHQADCLLACLIKKPSKIHLKIKSANIDNLRYHGCKWSCRELWKLEIHRGGQFVTWKVTELTFDLEGET